MNKQVQLDLWFYISFPIKTVPKYLYGTSISICFIPSVKAVARKCSVKKLFLKIFAKFTGKHLYEQIKNNFGILENNFACLKVTNNENIKSISFCIILFFVIYFEKVLICVELQLAETTCPDVYYRKTVLRYFPKFTESNLQ